MSDRTDEVRAAYDTVAETYAERFLDELDAKPADRELLDRMAERWRGAGPVLEVGCGPGHVGGYLAQRAVDMWGIDISPVMVDLARRLHPGRRFEVADMAALPCEDGSQAGVVGFYSIFHVERPHLPAVMGELARVMAPGATLVASFHEGEGTIHREEFLDHDVPISGELFESDEIAELVDGCGLSVETLTVRHPYPEEGYPRIYVVAIKPR